MGPIGITGVTQTPYTGQRFGLKQTDVSLVKTAARFHPVTSLNRGDILNWDSLRPTPELVQEISDRLRGDDVNRPRFVVLVGLQNLLPARADRMTFQSRLMEALTHQFIQLDESVPWGEELLNEEQYELVRTGIPVDLGRRTRDASEKDGVHFQRNSKQPLFSILYDAFEHVSGYQPLIADPLHYIQDNWWKPRWWPAVQKRWPFGNRGISDGMAHTLIEKGYVTDVSQLPNVSFTHDTPLLIVNASPRGVAYGHQPGHSTAQKGETAVWRASRLGVAPVHRNTAKDKTPIVFRELVN